MIMRKMDTRKELVGLVNKLSDEDLEEARRLLQELLEERCTHKSQRGYTLIEPMEDEGHLRPEFIAELKESEEAAKEGKTITLDAFLKGQSR
jgi:hypothetical protein